MSRVKKQFELVVDRRELATILAALRFHQDENLRDSCDIPDEVIKGIATDSDSLKPLDSKDVNRLCEKINTCDEISAGRLKRDWVLIIRDKGVVVHVRAYDSKTAAQESLFKYMQERRDYDGRKSLRAITEWIKKHSVRIGFDIVQQDILETAD